MGGKYDIYSYFHGFSPKEKNYFGKDFQGSKFWQVKRGDCLLLEAVGVEDRQN